jgi:hypothetical protein
MASKCNAVITLRAQNDESATKAIEVLTQIMAESGRTVNVFDNPFALTAALNPNSPEYNRNFVYIYTGKITSYNIGSWTKTLCGVFDNSIRCPAFYFYRYGLPGAGISSGCNRNFDILCPDITDQLSVALRAWDII